MAAALLSLSLGPIRIPFARVLDLLAAPLTGAAKTGRDAVVLFDVRLPRTALGLLVGAALGFAGAVMQGLFRNPLADPGLVGVSAGAALAVVFSIVLLGTLAPWLAPEVNAFTLPLAAFAGGLATTLILYAVATRGGLTSMAMLLLAGIALGALAGALTGLLVFVSDDNQLRSFTFWTLGSLAGATEWKTATLLLFCLGAFAATPFLAGGLNALALGEGEAFHLGVEVETVKRVAIVACAAAVGAAVAAAGAIGFVGLVVPHLIRLGAGPDHRYLLPAAALFGGALLLLADVLCRLVVQPAELPIGILTAAIGAPFFLWLLLRERPADWS